MNGNPKTRTATCRCGQLNAYCQGDPVRISVCHCLNCQKRTGSAFSAQARWPRENVIFVGELRIWEHVGESGCLTTYRFCPHCGSTIGYEVDRLPELIAVPIGAFADPTFPAPKFSVYEHRKHSWTTVLGSDVEHSSIPSTDRKPGVMS